MRPEIEAKAVDNFPGGAIDNLRGVNREFEKGLVAVVDGYRPSQQVSYQVVRGRYGPTLVIKDSYRPPVQKGAGAKLTREKIPGTPDSYMVGTVDGMTPANAVFEGYGYTHDEVVWGATFNDPAADGILAAVQGQRLLPEVRRLWRERMGVKEAMINWGTYVEMVDGARWNFADLPYRAGTFHEVGMSETEKRIKEIAYGCVLAHHHLRFLEGLGQGDHIWLEIRVGRRERHLVAVERTEGGYKVTAKPSNLSGLMARDLGLGVDAVDLARYGDYANSGDLVEEAAKIGGMSEKAVGEKLVAMRVHIADDVDSVTESKGSEDWSVRDGQIVLTEKEGGKVTRELTADLKAIYRLHQKAQELELPLAKIWSLWGEDRQPVMSELWNQLGLDPSKPDDVATAQMFAAMSFKFFSTMSPLLVGKRERQILETLRAVGKE